MPTLRYEVVPVALTPAQAEEFDLPSKPTLKPSEKRSEKWREAFGLGQVEIDAMIALHPNELRTMIEDAIKPYFDNTLAERVRHAKDEWKEHTPGCIDTLIWRRGRGPSRRSCRPKLGPYNNTIAQLEERLNRLARSVTLPPLLIPEAAVPEADRRRRYCQQPLDVVAPEA